MLLEKLLISPLQSVFSNFLIHFLLSIIVKSPYWTMKYKNIAHDSWKLLFIQSYTAIQVYWIAFHCIHVTTYQFTGRMLQKTTLLKKIISSIVIIASFVYICLATEQRSNIIVLLCGLWMSGCKKKKLLLSDARLIYFFKYYDKILVGASAWILKRYIISIH